MCLLLCDVHITLQHLHIPYVCLYVCLLHVQKIVHFVSRVSNFNWQRLCQIIFTSIDEWNEKTQRTTRKRSNGKKHSIKLNANECYWARDIHSMSSIWIKIGRFVFVKNVRLWKILPDVQRYVVYTRHCTHIYLNCPRWWTSSLSPPACSFSLPSITNSLSYFNRLLSLTHSLSHSFVLRSLTLFYLAIAIYIGRARLLKMMCNIECEQL